MKKTGVLVCSLIMLIILTACGNSSEKNSQNSTGIVTDADPKVLIDKSCITCHGDQLEGDGHIPSLNNVADRLTKDDIIDAIENGRPGMPILYRGPDAEAIAQWLVDNSQ